MPRPMVSVCVLAYKHREYIEKAIDSVLEQVCDFDVEIVVGEDCSNDGTKEILLDYEKKYPGKFVLLLNEVNIGANKNLYNVLTHCKGKYIANLESDDFWCDPYKLKKQVEYLEKNESVSAVGTNCYMYTEVNGTSTKLVSLMPYECNRIYKFKDFLKKGMFIHTNTLVYRNNIPFSNEDFKKTLLDGATMGDIFMRSCIYHGGSIYCSNDITLCHRQTPNLASSFQANQINNANKYTWMMINIVNALEKYFADNYDYQLIVVNRMAFLMFSYLMKRIKLDIKEYMQIYSKLAFKHKIILFERVFSLFLAKLRKFLYRKING